MPGNGAFLGPDAGRNVARTTQGSSLLDWLPGWSQAQAVMGLVGEVSDPAMWRSLGWIALGFFLLGTGTYAWFRQSSLYRAGEEATARAILGSDPAPDLTRVGKVRTPVGDAPVIPVLLILTGAYLAWFGVHYWRDQVTIWPSDPIKDVLRGLGVPRPQRSPSAATRVADATTAAGPGTTGTGTPAGLAGGLGVATGDAIAKDAASYAGKVPYKWSGASPATGWDCSGMVNWVLCHDMGLDIPGVKGGQFDGRSHGPNVAEWLAWTAGTEIIGVA